MATTGTQIPGVFVALHATAAQNAHGLDVQGLASMLGAMARMGTSRPHVFEDLCTAAGQQVQDFSM